MKKVISKEELQTKMVEAINLLVDTVKTTLGPKGSNVIIDHSAFSPFITNDGVTIASQIESDDAIVNTILELAKEASIKTNENVGDGTTSTLVLLQALFLNGLKEIKSGFSPIILKQELDAALAKIVPLIKNKSRIASGNELENIAKISANSNEIGSLIVEAFLKTRNIKAITIKESEETIDKLIIKKGYIIETMLASSYFLNKNLIELDDCNLLLINDEVNDLSFLESVLNEIISANKSLVILALDYRDDIVNEIVNLYLNENIKVILLKIPGYGCEKLDILNDLALISKGKVLNDYPYKVTDLGIVQNIKITADEVSFSYKNNKDINNQVNLLKKEGQDSKRIAMLSNCLVEIMVGAISATERREKKMRYEDALNAIFVANNGIVPGGGLTLLEIGEKYQVNTKGEQVLISSLKYPFYQILTNAGLDPEKIMDEIRASNYTKIYNVKKDRWEDKLNTEVIDPVDVVINSLTNAVSIAGMLLSTTSLIINEYPNNIAKEESYTEI